MTDNNEDIRNEVDTLNLSTGIEVYEINGPFFFGVANKFDETMSRMGDKPQVRIIRMRKVPFIDSTGLHNLEILVKRCHKENIKVILSGVSDSVYDVLKQGGFIKLLGEDFVVSNIHIAIEKANGYLNR